MTAPTQIQSRRAIRLRRELDNMIIKRRQTYIYTPTHYRNRIKCPRIWTNSRWKLSSDFNIAQICFQSVFWTFYSVSIIHTQTLKVSTSHSGVRSRVKYNDWTWTHDKTRIQRMALTEEWLVSGCLIANRNADMAVRRARGWEWEWEVAGWVSVIFPLSKKSGTELSCLLYSTWLTSSSSSSSSLYLPLSLPLSLSIEALSFALSAAPTATLSDNRMRCVGCRC